MAEESGRVQCALMETNPSVWRPTGRLLEIPAQGGGFKSGDFVLVIIRGRSRVTSFVTRLKSKKSDIWVSEILEAA